LSNDTLIGIDLGGTNCRGALVCDSDRLHFESRMATRIDDGLDVFFGRLVDFCRSLQQAGNAGGLRVRGVGIGVPGAISLDGTVRVSPNLSPLNGIPFAADLEKALGLSVSVANDANAVAWGEHLYGAGRAFDSFIVLTLGTGVGGGLVLGGRLWTGADGAAGEAGHVTVEPEGRPCGCGSRGCLEQYASATGIVRSVREALAAGQASQLSEAGSALTSRRVAEAARCGDRVARKALEQAGRRLGQALAGIANLLNLDGAVLAGGASESIDLMRPALHAELRCRAFEVTGRRLQVVRGELGERAGILGAAGLARAKGLGDS